ncbi:hypothetical protein TorRG33x02_116450 [Trema orientale]|uniref:Uncharacterized protein n=1 Tax=Trema orientale TaxID=63057 RepID=A0A2P5F426_TREOI|nr:hypothetical protein TorRG33x02_116450 [Trema orientale]
MDNFIQYFVQFNYLACNATAQTRPMIMIMRKARRGYTREASHLRRKTDLGFFFILDFRYQNRSPPLIQHAIRLVAEVLDLIYPSPHGLIRELFLICIEEHSLDRSKVVRELFNVFP